jgi:DNA repair protein RecN (Recombination protein N)
VLKTLRIRDLAIIEDVTVEFGPGLNVLTGETGAGKSIVVDALGLAAGDRAEGALVRAGAERATVEAVFELPDAKDLRERLDARGIDASGAELVVRREVGASGGGRVFLNGSPATVAVLREIGAELVELHGQHEHQSLLQPERHQEALDRFGGHEDHLVELAAAYDGVAEAQEAVERLERSLAEREARSAVLRTILREIDAVAPVRGETEALATERALLRNQGKVAELLDGALQCLNTGDVTAGSLAALAARRVEDLAQLDPSLAELARRLESARLELDDAGSALRDYHDGKQFEPGRLEEVEARLAALERLRLRYGADEDEILRARAAAAEELAQLDDAGAVAAARAGLRAAEARYASTAATLGKARSTAAKQLIRRLGEPIRELGLGKAQVEVAFAPARGRALAAEPGLTLHRRGAERVELLLAANPGEPARPLAKVASGGELSRLMLALHGVVEGAGGDRVLVFDEVDAGIGGSTADAVGAHLARIARVHQALCVTHLPQVAAHGDRHYHVQKKIVRGRTVVAVELLDAEGRVIELARMLGGKEATDASRRNAKELLAGAGAAARVKARR